MSFVLVGQTPTIVKLGYRIKRNNTRLVVLILGLLPLPFTFLGRVLFYKEDCSMWIVVNRQVIFIVVGVAAVIIAMFFAFGFMGTVKVDDKVKATLSELDNSTSNFLVRQMFRY